MKRLVESLTLFIFRLCCFFTGKDCIACVHLRTHLPTHLPYLLPSSLPKRMALEDRAEPPSKVSTTPVPPSTSQPSSTRSQLEGLIGLSYRYPSTTTTSPKNTVISRKGDFARVMDRCAWWIVSLLRRCERSGKRILAYVGRQDVRYAVLMLGAVKEGGGIRFVLSASEKKKEA